MFWKIIGLINKWGLFFCFGLISLYGIIKFNQSLLLEPLWLILTTVSLVGFYFARKDVE